MGYAGFDHSPTATPSVLLVSADEVPDPPGRLVRNGYHSSETVLALAARWASPALWRGGLFDIRALGAIHSRSSCSRARPPARGLPGAGRRRAGRGRRALVFFFTDVGIRRALQLLLQPDRLAALSPAARRRRGARDRAGPPRRRAPGRLFSRGGALRRVEAAGSIQAPLLALLGLRLAGVRPAGAWRAGAAWLRRALRLLALVLPAHARDAAQGPRSTRSSSTRAPALSVARGRPGRARTRPGWLRYSGTDAFRPTRRSRIRRSRAVPRGTATEPSPASTSRIPVGSSSGSAALRRRSGRCARATATSKPPAVSDAHDDRPASPGGASAAATSRRGRSRGSSPARRHRGRLRSAHRRAPAAAGSSGRASARLRPSCRIPRSASAS